jgi:hypothetical protein
MTYPDRKYGARIRKGLRMARVHVSPCQCYCCHWEARSMLRLCARGTDFHNDHAVLRSSGYLYQGSRMLYRSGLILDLVEIGTRHLLGATISFLFDRTYNTTVWKHATSCCRFWTHGTPQYQGSFPEHTGGSLISDFKTEQRNNARQVFRARHRPSRCRHREQ